MNIATITHIQPTGEPPYQSEHGALYSFIVTFDNNQSGKANSKSQTPPYKPGDRVGYEVTGNFKGMSIIKVSKNPDKAFGSAPAPQIQPPAQPAAEFSQITRVPVIEPVFGATVGMAMNNALELLTKGLEHDEVIERIITPEFWKSVWEVSSDQIRVARELEKGRLALSPKDRSKSIVEAKRAISAGPTTQTQDDETLDPPF